LSKVKHKVAVTKLRLIENIQKAVEQETLKDVSFSYENNVTKRTGETTNLRNLSIPAGSNSVDTTERQSGFSQEYQHPSVETRTSGLHTQAGSYMKKINTNRNNSQGLKAVFGIASKTQMGNQLPPISGSRSKLTRNLPLEQGANQVSAPDINMNQDLFDQHTFDALFMEQRGPVPPTSFKQIQKAPQSLLLNKSSVAPGQDFVKEELLHYYPANLNEQRSKEKQDLIFGVKSLKKEYGYFKQLEMRQSENNGEPGQLPGVFRIEVAHESLDASKLQSNMTIATEKTFIKE
jgi:hypothetical protein